MLKRIILAGLLGGIGMFVWQSIAHMALPLGAVGIQEIPNEQPVLAAMQAQLGDTSGLYFFPGIGINSGMTRQQHNDAMQAYGTKLAANPSGILIYHPPGAKAITPPQLLTEFLIELAEALVLSFLLAQTRLSTISARLGFITLAGVMAAITTNLPYWNWYGFPTSYTATYMMTQVVGYIIAGLIAATVLKGQMARALLA